MKLRIAPFVLMLAATAVLADEPAPIALGAAAPKADLKMKNVDGKEISIADVRGQKGTLVIFTCNHCPFVKQWETRIVDLGNAFLAQGIGVIAINANDPKAYAEDGFEAMQQRAKDRGMKFPYVVDATSGVARAFGASRTPEAFLFDKDGKLVYHGTIDDNGKDAAQVKEPYLKDALAAVAAGKTPPKQETKALGCSIKFRSEG